MNMPHATTAVDVLRDARQLYQSYCKAATRAAKVKNLNLLWDALESIRDEGSRDYSLAEVGRRLESLGGPKTQSLRNTQGAHFRDIITAYANAVKGATRYVSPNRSNVEQALDMVTDPSIRATLRMALEEAKRLKVVNDNLHAAFKNLQIGATLASTMETTSAPVIVDGAPSPPLPSQAVLSLRLQAALKKGIDPTRLAQQGFRISEDGGIENEHGDKIFPPSFVTAIKAVLGQE